MLQKLRTISAGNTNPYNNIALETYLLEHVEPGEVILYLWQNRRTVVIGKNQNGYRECHVERLEADGGFLARRLSGGGAVFHDMGNLNFTFLTRKDDYDVDRQLTVILEAVRKLGIQAEKTGRNDIAAGGRKFSGNAFYQSGDACYHHGTILLKVDQELMARYLNVSKDKLKTKGVKSVKSRVVNLADMNPDITVEVMKEKLTEAFGEVYGLPVEKMELSADEKREVEEKVRFFSSYEWKYGRKLPFDYEYEKRFNWGGIQVRLHVDEGRIQVLEIYSDALDTEVFEQLKKALAGIPYRAGEIAAAIEKLPAGNTLQEAMKLDLKNVICEMV